MIKLSLRLRSFAAALVALLFFIPLTAITIEEAFTRSLSQSMLEQMRIQSLALISEFEFNNAQAQMPEQLFNDKLNIPGSGLYAFVAVENNIVWRSLSTLNWLQIPTLSPPKIGEEVFLPNFDLLPDYFLFSYTAEFDNNGEFVPVSFFIAQDKHMFAKEQQTFSNTLWYWLGFVALVLLILLIVTLNMALSPISALIAQIKQAEQGNIERLQKTYPPELEKLKNSINHLLDTEQHQRSRYKNSLSDLAHSLKTPLAVLQGNAQLPASAQEPIKQIDNIIQRQLKRAVAGARSGWEQAVPIAEVALKLQSAMSKVHADKQLSIHIDVSADCLFKGDKTDLMELLGNLMDNACKAANNQIAVTGYQQGQHTILIVDDDGPGIAYQDRENLLRRGTRLDSYHEGQGIGLAVVSDLVSAYNGQLDIEQADIGGASIKVIFDFIA